MKNFISTILCAKYNRNPIYGTCFIMLLCMLLVSGCFDKYRSGNFSTNYDSNTGKLDIYVSHAKQGDSVVCVVGLTLTSPLGRHINHAAHFPSLYVDNSGHVGEQALIQCTPGWSYVYTAGCMNTTRGNAPLSWKSGWQYALGQCPAKLAE